ncbi:MAG: purine-nucleoside phosphorylase [Planctomycetota bacterium]
MSDAVDALQRELRERGFDGATLALVLGSGLGAFAERLDDARSIAYEELEFLPKSAVPGHAGRLVLGTLGGVRVLVQQGRVHLYEGWSAAEVTRAVRAFAALGCRGLVLTNAAGGVRPEWEPGTLMRITDHLNLSGRSPVGASERANGSPYDAELGQALRRAAAEAGVPLEAGVYAGNLGPAYETPAEVRMARWMGADAVGMSTVAEACAAAASGLRVAAISCITNHAAGITAEPLSHDEVVETGRAVAERFSRLLEHAVPELAAVLDAGQP